MDSFMRLSLIIFFGCTLLLQENLAEVICEKLPTNLCSFAISSAGKRCVLSAAGAHYYTKKQHKKAVEYACRETEVVPERLRGPYIESNKCVSACGVKRGAYDNNKCVGGCGVNRAGDFEFTQRLCSPACYRDCPNIIDFYDNVFLAAGKAGYLNPTAHCETQKPNVLEPAAFGPVLSIVPGAPTSAPPFI